MRRPVGGVPQLAAAVRANDGGVKKPGRTLPKPSSSGGHLGSGLVVLVTFSLENCVHAIPSAQVPLFNPHVINAAAAQLS